MNMKRLIVLCGLILGFVTFTAICQAQPSQTQQQPTSKGELKFDSETHDFGKIPQGKPVTVEFKFTNGGSEPLKINDVVPTCGCTIADFTKTDVKPGGTGLVKLTFNAAVASTFNKGITVKSNSEKTPVKMLYIKGEVVSSSSDPKK